LTLLREVRHILLNREEPMRKMLAGAVVMVGWCCAVAVAQAAQSKPLSELPGDLARWSTLWMDVPRAMYDVGMEEGPVAAVTWGPVKGTVMLIHTTTRTLREMAQPEKPTAHKSQGRRPGVIFQYEF